MSYMLKIVLLTLSVHLCATEVFPFSSLSPFLTVIHLCFKIHIVFFRKMKKSNLLVFIPATIFTKCDCTINLSMSCKIRISRHNLSEFQFWPGQNSSDFTRPVLNKQLAYGGTLTSEGLSCSNSARFQAV